MGQFRKENGMRKYAIHPVAIEGIERLLKGAFLPYTSFPTSVALEELSMVTLTMSPMT